MGMNSAPKPRPMMATLTLPLVMCGCSRDVARRHRCGAREAPCRWRACDALRADDNVPLCVRKPARHGTGGPVRGHEILMPALEVFHRPSRQGGAGEIRVAQSRLIRGEWR